VGTRGRKPGSVELPKQHTSRCASRGQGDFDDRASLDRVLDGAYGAYAVETPYQRGAVAGELRQGLAFAEAAKAAGIQHLVYSSVGSADRRTGIPHFF
jgi:uncharacterized protein YbjT (DUF2867 family)